MLTREELLGLVNKKVDTTKFTSLSERTINEELDDVLDEMGEDESVNDKIVTKLANRLKRIDGNLHSNVSAEVKKNKEAEEARKRDGESAEKQNKVNQTKTSDESDELKALKARLDAMEAANKERDAKAAKQATLESVKKGLKEKFGNAGLELNNYFATVALKKLEVSQDTSVDSLVENAEKIYNAELKEAGFIPDSKPNAGHEGGTGRQDDKEWDDIANMRKTE